MAGQESNDPVVRGRDAFSSQGEWDWYDSGTDSLKPLNPPGVPANQNGRKSNSSAGSGNGGGAGGGNGGGGDGFSIPAGSSSLGAALGPVFSVIAITLVVILLVGIVIGFIWAVMKMDFSKDEDEEDSEAADEVELAPVDKLPFEIDKSIGNFLDAARQAYQNRDFRKATIYLFSHTLITLDHNQLIRLTRGKTNRQYLAEIRQLPQIKHFYEQVMIAFEQAFFGDRQISQQQFESCWNHVDSFHQNINQHTQQRQTNQPQFNPMPA